MNTNCKQKHNSAYKSAGFQSILYIIPFIFFTPDKMLSLVTRIKFSIKLNVVLNIWLTHYVTFVRNVNLTS